MSKLFQKAKLAVKFRRAGEGHALNESSTPSTSNQSQAPQIPRKAPSSDTERAGQVQYIMYINKHPDMQKHTSCYRHVFKCCYRGTVQVCSIISRYRTCIVKVSYLYIYMYILL